MQKWDDTFFFLYQSNCRGLWLYLSVGSSHFLHWAIGGIQIGHSFHCPNRSFLKCLGMLFKAAVYELWWKKSTYHSICSFHIHIREYFFDLFRKRLQLCKILRFEYGQSKFLQWKDLSLYLRKVSTFRIL